ncbi:hypothetical protein IWX46DRAFT_69069 [Phyllosticta citricarpa]|uniref:Secreted protein n=1 Tax=Phyllosticta citricarpa TaxID=55181 RepID=A0ABR1MEH4_9PEZI
MGVGFVFLFCSFFFFFFPPLRFSLSLLVHPADVASQDHYDVSYFPLLNFDAQSTRRSTWLAGWLITYGKWNCWDGQSKVATDD